MTVSASWVGTMSALGHKRTSAPQYVVSALLPIATAKADSSCGSQPERSTARRFAFCAGRAFIA